VERKFEEFQHLDKQLRQQEIHVPQAISQERKRDVLRRCTNNKSLDPRKAELDRYLLALPSSVPCLEKVSELATFLGATETGTPHSTEMIQTSPATETQDNAEYVGNEAPTLSDIEPELSHLQQEQHVTQSNMPTLDVLQSTNIHNELPLSSDVACQHAVVRREQQQDPSLLSSMFPPAASADTKPEEVQPEAQSLHNRVQELEVNVCRLNEQLQNSEQALVSAQDECAAYKELVNVLQSEKDQAQKLPNLEASQEVEQETQPASMDGLSKASSSDQPSCCEVAEENTEGQAEPENKLKELHWKAGDQVSVWSNSCNQWCSGTLQRVDGENIIVEYRKPGCSETMVKTMGCDSKEVQLQGPRQHVSTAFAVGAEIGIWSKTNQKWLLGQVVKYENGMVTTKYQRPDSSEFTWKVLPEGHADLQTSDLMLQSH